MKMNERRKKNTQMLLLKTLHIVITVILFMAIYNGFYYSGLSPASHRKADYIVVASYLLVQIIFLRAYDAYSVGYNTVGDLAYSQSLASFFSGILAYAMVCLVHMALVRALPMVMLVTVQILWNILWCYIANRIYFRIYQTRKTAVIYRNGRDLLRLSEIRSFDKKFDIVKRIENPASFEEIEPELAGIECVCVAGVDASTRNGLAKYCVEKNIHGYFAPHVGDLLIRGAHHMRSFSVPILNVKRAMPAGEYLLVKRAFDILASLIASVLFSPLMLITALCIKLYDHGPVFYRQVRLTKDRKEFRILKFRSMKIDAEKDGVARLAAEHDDRITPIGKIIRAIRFDELPQLLNILKGDMSIVGPRPERPEIAAEYEKTVPAFGLRLQVKAGLTGYAQVYGKYNSSPYEKLQLDLMYINKMSLVEDMKIMFNTVKILFQQESTEGIDASQRTAMTNGLSDDNTDINVNC